MGVSSSIISLSWVLCLRTKGTELTTFIIKEKSNEVIIYFLKDFIYLVLEEGREGEREGEKHHCVVASHTPSTGDPGPQPRHVP